MRGRVPYLLGLGLLGFFVAFPFVYSAGDYDYIMHIFITAFFYAILASSWSMLAGYAGQFSFGHIGFMGIGAYGAALFSHYFWLTGAPTGTCTEFQFGATWLVIVNPIGVTSTTLTQDCLRQAMAIWGGTVQVTPMPVWLGVVVGSAAGGVAGLLIGLLVLRLRAAYLALFTLGFAEILKATISAEIEITRGQAGMEMPALFENGVTIL
jgi:branched-chain amino acid transport system permease protein